MAIYEYTCEMCGKKKEVFAKISESEDLVMTCISCGRRMSKVISKSSFVLKGGGWYTDGYSSKREK